MYWCRAGFYVNSVLGWPGEGLAHLPFDKCHLGTKGSATNSCSEIKRRTTSIVCGCHKDSQMPLGKHNKIPEDNSRITGGFF